MTYNKGNGVTTMRKHVDLAHPALVDIMKPRLAPLCDVAAHLTTCKKALLAYRFTTKKPVRSNVFPIVIY